MPRKPTPIPEGSCRFIIDDNDVLRQCTNVIKIKKYCLCRKHRRMITDDEENGGQLEKEQKRLRKLLREDPSRGISKELKIRPRAEGVFGEESDDYEYAIPIRGTERRSLEDDADPDRGPPGGAFGVRHEQLPYGTSSSDSQEEKYKGHIDDDAAEGERHKERREVTKIANAGPDYQDRKLLKKIDEISNQPPAASAGEVKKTKRAATADAEGDIDKEKEVKKPKKVVEAKVPQEEEEEEEEEPSTADADTEGAAPTAAEEGLKLAFFAGVIGLAEALESIITHNVGLDITGTARTLACTPNIKELIFEACNECAPEFCDTAIRSPTRQLCLWIAGSAAAAYKMNTMKKMASAPPLQQQPTNPSADGADRIVV